MATNSKTTSLLRYQNITNREKREHSGFYADLFSLFVYDRGLGLAHICICLVECDART